MSDKVYMLAMAAGLFLEAFGLVLCAISLANKERRIEALEKFINSFGFNTESIRMVRGGADRITWNYQAGDKPHPTDDIGAL